MDDLKKQIPKLLEMAASYRTEQDREIAVVDRARRAAEAAGERAAACEKAAQELEYIVTNSTYRRNYE